VPWTQRGRALDTARPCPGQAARSPSDLPAKPVSGRAEPSCPARSSSGCRQERGALAGAMRCWAARGEEGGLAGSCGYYYF